MKTQLTHFLTTLFSEFKAKGIKYCILRNYEELPHKNIGSDIDILITSKSVNDASKILKAINGIRITATNQRAGVVTYFMDGVHQQDGKDSLQVDFVTSLSWKGLDYLEIENVLNTAIPHETHSLILKPLEQHEAIISLFSSYLVGGWIKERYQDFVQQTFTSFADEIANELMFWLPEKKSNTLIKLVSKNQQKELLKLLPSIKKSLFVNSFKANPIKFLIQISRHYFYEIKIRYTSKPITQICVLGMDGAGKSTVINGLLKKMGSRAKEYEVIHLKPRLKRNNNNEVTVCCDPHAEPPRNNIISAFKLLSWVLLYHLRKTFHGHRNATLVIWDRYIYDVLVDPRRYRVALPRWIVLLIIKLAPKPQATILLDVPPEVAYARKPEVALEDMYEIRQAYLKLIDGMPNSKFIRTNISIDVSVEEAIEFISQNLARKA